MFPREITNTSVWIRHQLPFHAPPPSDGDRNLRRHIRSQYQNETEEKITEIVQKERCRLNLKWCFDEYFGGPIAHPTLGQIVTANVFGNVHLGYIVDNTISRIILVSVNTLAVLPAVSPDDIYSAEYSPFFENYLHDDRVYHSQHVLDWWSISKNDPQRQYTQFSSSTEILFSMCTDSTSDWPVGNETWFTHDVLPQRSGFIDCHKKEIVRNSTKNTTENAEQYSVSILELIPIPTDQSMPTTHYSTPCVVTIDQRFNSSAQVNMQHRVLTQTLESFHSNQCLRKQPHLLPSSVFSPSFVRQPEKLLLFSVLLICLITIMSPSVKNYVESFPLTLVPELSLGSLVIYNCYPQLCGCSLVLHDINNRDWFRALAVP